MENINSWKEIQWRDIEERIFRLQLRIFKAAANQELKKMDKLQKLLISSESAKYFAVHKVIQNNTSKNRVDHKLILAPKEQFILANQLSFAKKSLIRRTFRSILQENRIRRPLCRSTIKDHCKQMLVYLFLFPQWEAELEVARNRFKSERADVDPIKAVFLGNSTKTKYESTQKFIRLITPSKEEIKKHKLKLREIVQHYRGVSQEKFIKKLNPLIQSLAFSKKMQIPRKIFQDLDSYLFRHLWKWAQKRHPKISKIRLKDKYWDRVGNKNWVFRVKQDNEVILQLQFHSN